MKPVYQNADKTRQESYKTARKPIKNLSSKLQNLSNWQQNAKAAFLGGGFIVAPSMPRELRIVGVVRTFLELRQVPSNHAKQFPDFEASGYVGNKQVNSAA